MSWATFLKAHWGAIAATDFFPVEVLTDSGLVRYLVLFIIDLDSRRIEIAGISPDPDGRWMKQIARNLTDVQDGVLTRAQYLIHDRDPLFTSLFRETLRSSDVNTVKLPARSPNLNAYAERFVRSIKSERLSHIIPIVECHLRNVITQFSDHYHLERNHQGLNNRLIQNNHDEPDCKGAIGCHERLDGILK